MNEEFHLKFVVDSQKVTKLLEQTRIVKLWSDLFMNVFSLTVKTV